jgi:hypothetical protein
MSVRHSYLTLLVFLLCINTQAQLREKAHIQTDQSTYQAGDTLYFSIFLWASNDSLSSQVLYVELLSATNGLLQEQILVIKDGLASSYFILNDSLKTGAYRLAAYTNWQRNWGDSAVCTQSFFVVPNAAYTISRAVADAPKSLQFYAEGGHLVEELPSVLVFKATDSLGRGAVVRGDVLTSNGTIAAHLQTDSRGIGSCLFVPLPNQQYQARVFLAHDTLFFSTPVVLPTGYVLQINRLKSDSLVVKIFVKQTNNDPQRLTLVGQAGGQIVFAATDSSGYRALSLPFSTRKFSTGLIHFSLFDGQNKLQCQRTIFVNHHDQPTVKLHTNQDTLTVQLTDSHNEPIAGHFSVSIQPNSAQTDYDSLDDNMATRLLLTSAFDDLIDQPQQYFGNTNTASQRLDELILTQKSSNELRKLSTEKMYRIEQGLTISGHVTRNNKPLAEATILALDNRTKALHSVVSDQNGCFVFENIMVFDSIDWTVQALNGQKKIADCMIEFDERSVPVIKNSPPFWQFGEESLAESTIQKPIYESQTKTDPKTVKLAEVTVKAKRTEREPRKLYHADYTITAEDIKDIGSVATDNVLRILQNRVPGFTLGEYFDQVTGLPKISIRLRGFNSFEGNNQPLFLVNGIPFGEDANLLEAISINDIAKIEVIRSAASANLYGSRGTSGIVAITTKSGSFNDPKTNNEPVVGIFRLKIPALSFSKMYIEPINGWWPSIKTDSLGKATMIYNHDHHIQEITVKIQGLTTNGKPIALRKKLKIL